MILNRLNKSPYQNLIFECKLHGAFQFIGFSFVILILEHKLWSLPSNLFARGDDVNETKPGYPDMLRKTYKVRIIFSSPWLIAWRRWNLSSAGNGNGKAVRDALILNDVIYSRLKGYLHLYDRVSKMTTHFVTESHKINISSYWKDIFLATTFLDLHRICGRL